MNNEEEKTDLIILEIENIKKFEDILIKLSKEIDSREKNILNIKNLTEEMKQIEKNENNINTNDLNNKKIMNCFLNSIISYRVHSIKVVEYYLLFKEKILQGNFRNKFDEELIKKKYNLTKNGINYLIKMKNDMNFLTQLRLYSNKNIEEIFESFKGDPFLISLYNIVPASREYKQRIKYCEYFIMQESMYNKSFAKKNLINNNYKLNEITENKNYQKKKLEPISNVNINKYKTEINSKEFDFPLINKNEINQKKVESNTIINNKEEENKKISEFDYKENLKINNDIVNLNIKKIKLNVNKEKEKEIIKDNKDKITEKNILQNSLTLSKKMKKKEESRASTPESKKLNKNEKIINNNIKNYNASYYSGSLSDFILIYNSYYQRIPLEQKRIFNIKSNPLEYFYHNYYPKIIICSDSKVSLTKGICIYSIILNYDNKPNRIIIEHISSYSQDEMENIFKIIFSFLKNNNIFSNSSNNISNEIYIDLYFYLEKEKFQINTYIRDFIKNELKFKWVKLENISKEIRYQKMKHLFNTNNNVLLNNEIDDNNVLNQSIIGKKALKEMNENADDIFEDNLICNFLIKNKSIIKYINKSQIKEEKENNLIFNNIKYINSFNIIHLIKKIPEDCIYSEYIENNTYNFFNMNEHLDIEEILNNNDNISLNDILQNNSFLTSDLKQLTDFFNNKYNKNEITNNNKFNISAKMNIFPLFDNIISVKYNHYFYNRIETENIKILIEKETKQKFYFLTPNNNKNDNVILLISSSLNENFINKYIIKNNTSNLSLKFIDIYNNITSCEENNKNNKNNSNKKYLYIPSFIINSKIKLNYKNHKCPDNQEELNIDNNDIFIMNKYKEFFNIKFFSEDFIGETKMKNKKNKLNSSINFYYDKIEEDFKKNKDCIIDDNFIIFVLNFNIIDNFATIPLLSLYITKDNFISDKVN